jgi:hypothetical protein
MKYDIVKNEFIGDEQANRLRSEARDRGELLQNTSQ